MNILQLYVAGNHYVPVRGSNAKFTLSEFLTANIPKIGQSMAPMYDDVEYVDMRFRAKWVVMVFLSAVEYEVINSS